MKVLLAEADPTLGQSIADWLGRESFAVSRATALEEVDPASVVVIGEVDGWAETIRSLREQHPAIRIVVLAGQGEAVAALEAGADDVLLRDGLSLRELALRVRAVRRRNGVAPEEPLSLEAGPLVVDMVNQTVALDGQPIAVAPAELRVLSVLAASAGRVVDRETLMLRAWGDDQLARRTVDSVVKRLRIRLGPHGRLIETVRGVGYRLDR